jgi:tetratricopeptide (TPR) repeat protein
MRALLYRTLILLAVFGLILTPPILTGYANLHQAQATYLALDDIRAAESFERAALLLPWRPDLWNQAGITRFRIKDYESAIRMLEIAKEKDVLSDVGWDVLGISYVQRGKMEEATVAWESGLESYPNYSKYYSHLIFVYHDRGDTQAEKEALERWVRADGATDAAAHYRLGKMLSISDQERALEEFLLAASLDPDYDSAVETMHTAIDLAALESDDAIKLVLIGRGLGLVGEWDLAAEAYRQAVNADEENAEALAWLGEAEQQLGRDGRAELNKALSLDYRNPIVHSLSGLYWLRQGQPGIALAEYKLAAIYDPNNPAWQLSIGEAYALNGDLQAALGSYFRATEIAPDNATTWQLLAAFSAQYNMQVEEIGLPAAQTAVELSDEDPLALDMLGWTLALLERYDEAQDTLEHALSLDPELAQGHLHLGIVSMQIDDWEVAREHLQRAQELEPDNPVGEQAQRLLSQYFP